MAEIKTIPYKSTPIDYNNIDRLKSKSTRRSISNKPKTEKNEIIFKPRKRKRIYKMEID